MTTRKKVYVNFKPLIEHKTSIIKYVGTERGDGKSTQLIKTAYESFESTGKIPVLSRRFSNDITSLYLNTTFNNLRHFYPNIKNIKFKGSPKKDGVHAFYKDKEVALFIPLSRIDGIKSALDWSTHKNLYIDEYVPLNARYLPDEAEKILELYRTIDRDHYDNYILVCANKVTATNPLFNYFDIPPVDGLHAYKNGRFLSLLWRCKGNEEEAEKSPLGELVSGTPYAGYNRGEVLNDFTHLTATGASKNFMPFYLRCDGIYYALYLPRDTELQTSRIIKPTTREKLFPVYYVDKCDGGRNGGTYLGANRELVLLLRDLFFSANLYFDSQKTFERLKTLIKLIS